MKNNMWVLGLKLMLIVAFVVAMLSVVNVFTRGPIAEREEATRREAMESLMPSCTFEQASFGDGKVFEARSGDTLKAYCVSSTGSGFGGDISMMVAVSPDGIVLGCKVLSNSETPGVGSKAVDNEGEFIPKLTHLSRFDDVETVSGATISSKAVLAALQSAVKTVVDAEVNG